ncbi:hypothetical protein HPC49_36570 [Pyxidicoccus fallax]|uniref:Tetratricopeptide repeat protein n=1 Tax=Pyxidicoccus fallax TaxID=394095 RepID=A0A848LY47_9BACT|nr:tetratricopeptide repeat protein [Pyxidicoccus fallax]NMO22144.1 tetratricopeptide repeat protein [Pyxidicoccus fallax]NPC83721.1 hypothetical protein [Pyxidicoccus fallax]
MPKKAWFDKLWSRVGTAENERWYVVGAQLVAILTFFLALLTTFIGEQRLRQEAISNTRAELRAVLQRLYTLPAEDVKLRLQISAETGTSQPSPVGGYVIAEQHMLIRHASELLAELRELNGQVYSIEYGLVAHGLIFQGDFNQAEALFKEALEGKKNVIDEVVALRGLAAIAFTRGDLTKGRETYERTIEVTTRHAPSPDYAVRTNAETYLLWTQTELLQAECIPALQQLQSGLQLVAQVKPGLREGMKEQFDQLIAPFRVVCASLQLPPGVGGSGRD